MVVCDGLTGLPDAVAAALATDDHPDLCGALCRPPDYADMAVESLAAHRLLDYEVGIIRGAATSMIRRCRGHAQAASTQNYLPADLVVTKHSGQDPGATSIRSASPCRYCPPGTIHRGGKASDYADLTSPNPLPRNRSRLTSA